MHSFLPSCLLVVFACSSPLLALALVPSGSANSDHAQNEPAILTNLSHRLDSITDGHPNFLDEYELALNTTSANRTHLLSSVLTGVTTMAKNASALQVEMRSALQTVDRTLSPDFFSARMTARVLAGRVAFFLRMFRSLAVELFAALGHEPISSSDNGGHLRFVFSDLLQWMNAKPSTMPSPWESGRTIDRALGRVKSDNNNSTNQHNNVNATARAEVIELLTRFQSSMVRERDSLAKAYYNERERIETVEGARVAVKQQVEMEFLIDFTVSLSHFISQYRTEFVRRYPVVSER